MMMMASREGSIAGRNTSRVSRAFVEKIIFGSNRDFRYDTTINRKNTTSYYCGSRSTRYQVAVVPCSVVVDFEHQRSFFAGRDPGQDTNRATNK